MRSLSVVVPCYNVAGYAAQTVRSLQRSAAPGIEFLLLDDASTDDTRRLLEAAARQLPGARVISYPENRGVAAVRNDGIREATGDYITFLDGDDFVAPGYYPALLDTIVSLGCDLVRTDHVRVTGQQRTVHRINHGRRGVVSRPRDAILPAHRATSVDVPNAWAGVYHRRLADAGTLFFAEHLRTCEDRLWNWRLHLQAETFAVVGLLGLFYRRDVDSSLTRVLDAHQFDFVPAFDQIIDEVLADSEAERLLPKAVRSYCAMVCWHLDRTSDYQEALGAELTAICTAAVQRLPRRALNEVVAALDPVRAETISRLQAA